MGMLGRAYWGKGYINEGCNGALDAFEEIATAPDGRRWDRERPLRLRTLTTWVRTEGYLRERWHVPGNPGRVGSMVC